MADEYGTGTRQLVKDQNSGSTIPTNAPTVSKPTYGLGTNKKFTVQQQNMNMGWADALVDLGGKAAVHALETAEQRKLTEDTLRQAGYEGKVEHEQSFIGQMFSPKSKVKRQIQQNEVSNSVQSATTKMYTELSNYQEASPEEYQVHVQEGLQTLLAQYEGDAETQAMIVNDFNKYSGNLARAQAKKYNDWATGKKVRQTADRMLNNRQQTEAYKGDDKAYEQSYNTMKNDFLNKPEGVAAEAFEAEQAAAIIEGLQQGNEEYYNIAQESGLVFDRQLRSTIQAARDTFVGKQDAKYSSISLEGEQLAKSGDPVALEEWYKANSKEYNQLGNNINKLRRIASINQEAKMNEAQVRQQRTNAFRSGTTMVGTKAEREEAVNAGINQLAVESIQQATGNYSNPISPQEIQQWVKNNPNMYKEQWHRAGSKVAAITNMASGTMALAHKNDLTEEEVVEFNSSISALQTLNERNPTLLRKHFVNEDEYTRFKKLIQYTHRGSQDPVSALQSVKNQEKAESTFGKIDISGQAIERGGAELAEKFTDQNGESYLGLGIFMKDPENGYELQKIATRYYQDALLEHGGNKAKAMATAEARLIGDGTTVGNTFIPNGAAIERDLQRVGTGANLNDLITSLDADEGVRKYLMDKGFPEDFDLTNGEAGRESLFGNQIAPGVTISQDTQGKLILQTRDANGLPVTAEIDIPNREQYQAIRKKGIFEQAGEIIEKGYNKVFGDEDAESEQLKVDEGVKDVVYNDSLGLPTAGVGHLLTEAEKKKYPVGTKIPQEQVDKWYKEDLQEARSNAKKINPHKDNSELENILTNMSFNMGPNRFSPTAWPNFFKAVREENWEQAAKQMENSKWFTQVGNRADRLIERMKNL